MSVSGAYDDGFDEPVRDSALVGWPVLWNEPLDGKAPITDNIHITGFYWRDEAPAKSAILDAIAEGPNTYRIYRGYRTINVDRPDAFGEAEDYPVLRLDPAYDGLHHQRVCMDGNLRHAGLATYDQRFTYVPHCSVDLKTLLDPPDYLIVGPPTLWYKDDAPVEV